MELEKNKCCFCGKEIDKFSTNDARPIKVAGLDFAGCCDECNAKIVIPTRIAMKRGGQKIMCKKCGDIIQSKSVHDYVTCKCGAVAIDGGTDYTRITGNKDNWEYVLDREILFRGKLLNSNDWMYGYYSKIQNETIIEDCNKEGYYRYNLVESNTVGQYTGQTDKNGTKIFEGDIVLTDGLINTKVVWDADRLMWGLEYPKGEKVALYSFEKWDIEVVGNIYDNYELLTH